MFCPHCAKQIEEDSKFCTHCGNSVTSAQQAAAQEVNHFNEPQTISQQPVQTPPPYQPTQQPVQQPQRTNLQDNPYVRQGKEISKMYFGFALQVLKSPYKVCKTVTQKDMLNGIISLVLVALLIPLYSYMAARKVASSFGFGDFRPEVPFFEMVVTPFLVLLILLLAISGTLYLVAKMMLVNVNFKDVVAKFGAIMTVPVTLFLIANIAVLLSLYVFSGVLIGVGSSAIILAITATVFALKSKQPEGGLDAYYGVFITYIIIVILFMILGESIANNILSNIEDGIDSLLW